MCYSAPSPRIGSVFRPGAQLPANTRKDRPLYSPKKTAPDVAHWVMHHFGAWIRCFGVVPTRIGDGVPTYDQTKGEYLGWLGRGDIMVDDSADNIHQAESLGLRTLQLAQPWNDSRLTICDLLDQLSNMADYS